MTKTIFTKCLAAALMLFAVASSQPIGKTGACPTLTRSNSYMGINLVNGTPSGEAYAFTGKSWQVTPRSWQTSAGQIQDPLTPAQSVNCVQVPTGLKAEIIASELTPGNGAPMAYPMNFTFDERGRMWVIEPRDYPFIHDTTTGFPTNTSNGIASNRLAGKGRILIFEDVNGDGAMDNFKVFYTGLAMPTSIELVKNGVIVTVPPNIYIIPNANDVAGTPQIVVSGMGSSSNNYDAHGQTNSLTYGLDNYVYGHVGYNGCGSPVVGSNPGVTCGGGNIWRFKATAIGSDTNQFQIVSNNGPSNSHGIGQMEDGQWFKSGATLSSHSNHQVRFGQGANDIRTSTGSGTTGTNRFFSMTSDRWLWEGNNDSLSGGTFAPGGYFSTQTSAVSGHDFYTARLLPQQYWNRFGFACEGASGLCNEDSLSENGSTWRANRMLPPGRNPNIFASTDAWTAPLKVRTGPDGALYVLDWYNYLFLHNPATPATDAAWRNPLRAKSRARFYRILPADGHTDVLLNLTNATPAQLVSVFWSSNFTWRLMAQRQLLWRNYTTVEKDSLLTLLENVLTQHRYPDTVGIDGPVLHSLWTLHGMGEFKTNPNRWNPILKNLLLHPAWSVRRNVALAMPRTAASAQAIVDQCAVNDTHAHVRVQMLDALAAMPAPSAPAQMVATYHNTDTYSTGAFTSAGASKVVEITGTTRPTSCASYTALSAPDAAKPNVPSVGVRSTGSLEARNHLRFSLTHNGFELQTQHGQLPSGELVVYDLRGSVAFRSTYNSATGTWSQKTASGLNMSVYFYSFRGVNGDKFDGRIFTNEEL
ncbi:MAG TPA: hypothetical protein DCQ83_09120 [Fibrobacteres bacterium]|nr:hypothetical protein [Fibrobacterota bacterium]